MGPTPRPAPAGVSAKKTKAEVNYSEGTGMTRCRNCVNYRPMGLCTRVSGVISPEYWCKLFKPR